MTPEAKSTWPAVASLALFLAAQPAYSELPAASLGKQRALNSHLEWEIREAGHPTLGNIRFGFLKNPVETPVGNAKVFSRAYLSCQKGSKKFAIELANATAPDDPGGLRPSQEPRLYCNRPIQPFDEKLVQEPLLANWDVSKIGDALARGFRAFPLRECVSISVVQEVVLPAGWAQKTAQIEFEILPYDKDLDAIFVTCGEQSAYAPAAPVAPPVRPAPPAHPVAAKPAAPAKPPAIAAAPAKPPPIAAAPVAPSKPAPQADVAWQAARTLSTGGKTNVRAGPNLQSAIVAQLEQGTSVLVQRTGNDWWRAKAAAGPAFDGYIRQDRLDFK